MLFAFVFLQEGVGGWGGERQTERERGGEGGERQTEREREGETYFPKVGERKKGEGLGVIVHVQIKSSYRKYK